MLHPLLCGTVQVLGQCINAAAVTFDAVPELAVLPPHLFASVVRTALGIQCPRALLQVRLPCRDQ
jgi:hypothetical protein